MTDHMYHHKPWEIAAIRWTGENFPEIEQFARDWIGEPDEIDLHCELWTLGPSTGHPEGYTVNTLQFTAWGRNQEADPEDWVVVHDIAGDRGRGEIVWDDDFREHYQPTLS